MRDRRMYHLAAGGDVFIRTRSGAGPFAPEILETFKSAEIGWLNLESPITDHDYAEEKAAPLRVDKQQVKWLRKISEKVVVSLANNHMLDCGLSGLQDTIETLQSSGIGYVGTLQNSISQEPYWAELNCGKLAILSYTVGGKIINGTGIADLNEFQIIEDIKHARLNSADWVVVSLHWGIEYTTFPSPTQQRIARAFVDAGADVIVGSHPHVVQGIERYKKSVIFYSLGNFNFHTTFDEYYPSSDWGMVALISLDRECVRFEIIPIKISSDYRAELMSIVAQAEFRNYLTLISTCLSDGVSPVFWLRHVSATYLLSNLRGFQFRIKRYGWTHFWAMVKWLLHPRTYPYYLGLLLRAGQFVIKK